MRKIINPWQEAHIFHCFGCDSLNPIGLKMRFFEEGEQIICFWKAESSYQGYVDTLHGGIHSTLHDELASWVVYVKGKTAGMTSKIDISFYKPVPTDGTEVKLIGTIKERDMKSIVVHTQLFNQIGELSSEATVVYRIFPQELAIKKLFYPGPDAFFE
jgi:acyl-coenzyme A thioesterase PaaI-like protein